MNDSQKKTDRSERYWSIWERTASWHIKTAAVAFICAAAVLVIVLGLRSNIFRNDVFFANKRLVFPRSDAFILLGAGLCGYQYGLLMFLLIFFVEAFVSLSVGGFVGLFPLFLYLALALAAGYLAQGRMFLGIQRTLCSFALLETILSLLFYLIFALLIHGVNYSYLECLIVTIPECAVAVALLYLFFRYAPDGVKESFGTGNLYESSYDRTKAAEECGKYGELSLQITALSVVEGIILSVAVMQIMFADDGFAEWEMSQAWQGYNTRAMLFLLSLIVTFSVVLTGNEVILGIISRVIKSQQKLETELAVSEARSEAKSTFLSNMSHEIRTTINVILGMNEMILRESSEDEILQYAGSVRTAGNTLLGLVNDILDFSKIEAGKLDVISVNYQLSSVLNDLINMTQMRAESKGLEFILEIDPEIPDYLYGDEIRIKQIATNILTNAVKYTKQGSVRLTVGYTMHGEKEINLRFAVKDTGIGIKEENIGKLFTVFERIEEERNRSIEGTGLGMNITRRLVTLMDGDIQVESTYGKGSTFTFILRQQIVRDIPIGNYEEAYRKSVSELKKYKESFTAPSAEVLVVDDTEMNLVVFKGLLKKTKVQIDTAKSGYVCLEKSRSRKYNLIFLDHRMPDKDGIETLRDLRTQKDGKNMDTPVVCLTANAISGAREEYLAAGFTDYLTKPIDAGKLERLMVELLPKDKVYIDNPGGCFENVADGNDGNLTFVKDAGHRAFDRLEDYMQEALVIYMEGLEENAAQIEEFYRDEDWKNYAIKVHSLKSTSRMVGEEEIGNLAEEMEYAADRGDIAEVRRKNADLLERYRSLKNKYGFLLLDGDGHGQKVVNNDEKTVKREKNELTEAMWKEAMAGIREMAGIFDEDGIKSILEQMADYVLSDEQKQKVEIIKDALQKLEWDKVIE